MPQPRQKRGDVPAVELPRVASSHIFVEAFELYLETLHGIAKAGVLSTRTWGAGLMKPVISEPKDLQ